MEVKFGSPSCKYIPKTCSQNIMECYEKYKSIDLFPTLSQFYRGSIYNLWFVGDAWRRCFGVVAGLRFHRVAFVLEWDERYQKYRTKQIAQSSVTIEAWMIGGRGLWREGSATMKFRRFCYWTHIYSRRRDYGTEHKQQRHHQQPPVRPVSPFNPPKLALSSPSGGIKCLFADSINFKITYARCYQTYIF